MPMGMIVLQKKQERDIFKMKTLWKKKIRVDYIALVVCPILTFYLCELYTHNPFQSMNIKTQLLNMIFYELTALLLWGIFRTLRIALMLQSAFFMLFGLANYYVISFRAAPIRPWDIYSLRTAASVADNYSYSLEAKTVWILVIFAVLFLLESRFRMKHSGGWKKRMLLVILPLVLLWGYMGMVQNDHFVADFGLYDKFFTPTVVNKRCGNAVAFCMAMEYMAIEKPKDYSAERMDALLQGYGEVEKAADRPNIIVIMNEAFSDLAVLGDMTTNRDYMPFIHSLQQGAENTITGTLHVSVLGGNTANTEFEFLTGSTMAFLPQGSVAYQQYLQNKMPSLASYLKEQGYETVALHPYNAAGWDRNRVYPLLGFDRFLSLRDFDGAMKIRKYVSDTSCFDKIIEIYEEKKEGEPLFLFNVTMQNHGGYTEEFANFVPEITVDGITEKSLPMYLSLLEQSDAAFKELVEYFKAEEEDTMLVFFGDHQPTTFVSNPILRSNGRDPEKVSEEEMLAKYKVPYVIWSNFDIKEASGQESSVNYLMLDVLEQCGLPLTPFQRSLEELREKCPIISAMELRDKAGNIRNPAECEEELNNYRSWQYYYLFDFESFMDK